MWKKSIRIFFISLLVAMCIPMIACAGPAEDKEETVQENFFDYFNLDKQKFVKQEDDAQSLYIDLTNSIIDKEDIEIYEEEDINTFSNLHLNEGFHKKIMEGSKLISDNQSFEVSPTFSSIKNISGTGDEGIVIGVLVYNYTEDNVINITYQSEYHTVGPSMIFNEAIELNTLGVNNIIIAVMKDDEVEYRRYIINRKEEETKEKLENIEIEFLSEEKDEVTQSNETFDFLETIDNKKENTITKQK